jgi:pyrrolidone-carboxylate peptidase
LTLQIRGKKAELSQSAGLVLCCRAFLMQQLASSAAAKNEYSPATHVHFLAYKPLVFFSFHKKSEPKLGATKRGT